MISKELLSEVLEYPKQIECNLPYSINIKEVTHIDKNKLYFNTDNCGIGVSTINIYELAHKVKMWAYKYHITARGIEHESIMTHGYNAIRLLSGVSDESFDKYECSIDNSTRGAYRASEVFYAGSECEAILKAGEWILDNQEFPR